jgi:hypothetical protein
VDVQGPYLEPGPVGDGAESDARALRASRWAVVPIAIYTAELFATGHDDANRAAVRAVATEDLDLVGIGLRGQRTSNPE